MCAALLTPLLRPAISGPAPLALIDAPQAGTGKSLLVEVAAIIATGRSGEMIGAPQDPAEWAKLLTTILRSGVTVAIFDNVDHPLNDPSLAKVLTESIHRDRILGTHDEIVVPVKTTFFATGNNLQVGGDMPRRCYRIRLDAESSRPADRTGFAISPLKDWAQEHRGELLAALLTLARAWYAGGCPRPKVKPMGSFESWCRVVGGILEFAGIDGFLGNREALYEESSPDSVQWEAFLSTIAELFDRRSQQPNCTSY